ncbi:MAG: hypothetical protein RR275_02760 [Lachnospiraceae bacterium]
MNQDSITGDIMGVTLRQLGATSIKVINSQMNIVDFELDGGLKVSYVFNITKNDKYFLQRMRPYAMTHGKFANDKDIVEFIKTDITKFRNASHSSNFQTFLNISETGNQMVQEMEHLFLNHNVGKETLEDVEQRMEQLIETIHTQYEKSTYIPIDVENEIKTK